MSNNFTAGGRTQTRPSTLGSVLCILVAATFTSGVVIAALAASSAQDTRVNAIPSVTCVRQRLNFVANFSQIGAAANFVSRGPGYRISVTPTEAALSFQHHKLAPVGHAQPDVLRIKLVGANPDARAAAAEPLPGRVNFFIGSDARQWRTKYQKGASVPTGQTEFQFQMASFDFKSTDYQWLVIERARAQYKGHGTVNGVSGYSFMLTATDGEINGGGGVDKFRIHITNTSAGGTVYDNVPGAADDINNASPEAIAGGNIVIHSN